MSESGHPLREQLAYGREVRSRLLVILLALVLLPTASAQAEPAARTPESVLADMTLAQRVGQLFMVGSAGTEASEATLSAIRHYHVGSVIVMGNQGAGRRPVARTVRELQASREPDAPRLFVAADQEGGSVQHLTGPGFADMPSALTQGTWRAPTLRKRAGEWAGELDRAGVNLDLAPVADTVPLDRTRTNRPIGRFHREYGHWPRRVARHAAAVVRGMRDAGVATAAKHFPGLGRVRGNTDLVPTVLDRETRAHDSYLRPFAATIGAGVPFVMISLATYTRIDPAGPAAFSRTVIEGMLRGDLGFRGVVVSDSLQAAAVSRWSPGRRAVRFVRAGGDLLLVTTAAPVPEMYRALVSRARRSPAFRARVDRAALRVLRAKQAQGLL